MCNRIKSCKRLTSKKFSLVTSVSARKFKLTVFHVRMPTVLDKNGFCQLLADPEQCTFCGWCFQVFLVVMSRQQVSLSVSRQYIKAVGSVDSVAMVFCDPGAKTN